MQPAPIIAIHGSASSGAMWKPLQQHCQHERQVLTPDLLGYGENRLALLSQTPDLAYRARPLIQCIKQCGAVHLVAHSFGGSVALEIIRTIPQHIKSLTLYEPVMPAIFKGSDGAYDQLYLADLIELSKIVSGTEGHVGMETFLDFWSVPGAWQNLPQPVKDKLAQLAPIVFRDFQEAINEAEHTYSHIPFKKPVHILVGDKTTPHAKRMADLLIQKLPHGQIELMSDMGHMGPTTHSQQVSQAILNHIENCEQRNRPHATARRSNAIDLSLPQY